MLTARNKYQDGMLKQVSTQRTRRGVVGIEPTEQALGMEVLLTSATLFAWQLT
jgi:hypothetical protein